MSRPELVRADRYEGYFSKQEVGLRLAGMENRGPDPGGLGSQISTGDLELIQFVAFQSVKNQFIEPPPVNHAFHSHGVLKVFPVRSFRN